MDDSDIRAVLDATAALVDDPVPGFEVVLGVLRDLIRCDSASFNDMTLATGDFRHVIVPADREPLVTRLKPAYDRFAHQHPIIRATLRSSIRGALRFCDVEGGDEITGTDLFRAFYEPFGVRYQLALQLPSPPDVVVAYALNRSAGGGEFHDRDVAVLDSLSAHLSMHHRQVVDRERARAVAVDGDGPDGWTVLAVRSDGVVDQASSPWSSRFAPSGQVPPSVRALLPADVGAGGTRQLVTVGEERWRCVVHPVATGPSVVMVRRQGDEPAGVAPLVDLGLTPRQTEVAVALARSGGTNAQLARDLGVAEGTAKKHLEAVFRALGVDSRAGAVAALRSLIG